MANIVSCGHRKTTERNEKKTFVFGSSTPRDLSYMNSVPTTLRIYDSKIKPIKQAQDQTLAYFMRQARSVTRKQSKSRDDSGDRAMRGTYAFGSSTPRILSHLYGTAREYSDDKINPQVGRRSYTTPTFPTSKTVASPLRVQMKRTNGIIQKPNGTEEKNITSKNTCRVQSTNHQSKKGSEDFIKKKLKIQNDTTKTIKKAIAKEKQSKSGKTDIRQASAEKEFAKTVVPEESEEFSPVYVAIENESEKVLLLKEREKVKLTDEIQLLNANTVENEAKMLPVKSTAVAKTITKEVAEDDSFRKTSRIDNMMESTTIQILHEGLEGEKTDVSIQPGSIERDDLTDTFSIATIKYHVNKNAKSNSEYKDGRGRKFFISSGSQQHEPSPSIGIYNAVPTAIINDPATMRPSSSSLSVFEKSFSLPNDNGKLKDDIQLHCPKHSEDEIKSRETVAKNSNDEQIDSELKQYRFSKIRESILKSLHQLQENDSAASGKPLQVDADHEIIYNQNYEYYSGTPIRQECIDAKKSDSKASE